MYPPRPGVDEPTRFVPSIRWELLRKGTEDAERMLLLQRLIAQAKKDGKTAGGVVAAGEAALAAVSGLVWGFPATIESVSPLRNLPLCAISRPFPTDCL